MSERRGATAAGEVVHPHDLELAQAALRREAPALRAFVDRMRCVPRMIHARNLRTSPRLSPDDIEDVVQETLAAVWKKLDRYDGRARLETWIYSFCFHELMRRRRSNSARRDLEPDVVGTELEPGVQDSSGLEESEEVQAGLEQLGPTESQVIVLKHYELMTFEEIGTRLGIPTNSAKTRYYRGLAKLRSHLGKRTEGAMGTQA